MLPELLLYARQLVGTPYAWGGDDPIGGFDCSGLVSELLRAGGLVPWNYRNTAAGIYADFEKKSTHGVSGPGALAFYGKDLLHIDHVAFMVSKDQIIEAGGGNAQTTSDKVRIDKNAFVRLRPFDYRKDFLISLKPVYRGSI